MRPGARVVAVAAVIIALALHPAAAAIDNTDPLRLARAIYALYGKGQNGFDLQGPDARAVIAPSLLALIAADAAQANGEVGALDFDPFCGCQDFTITDIRPAVVSAGTDRVIIAVAFRNFGKPHTTKLTLQNMPGGWHVADIGTPDTPSLARYLTRSLHR